MTHYNLKNIVFNLGALIFVVEFMGKEHHIKTKFRRNGSVTLRNEMNPFYWLIVPVTSILTNRTASFRCGLSDIRLDTY